VGGGASSHRIAAARTDAGNQIARRALGLRRAHIGEDAAKRQRHIADDRRKGQIVVGSQGLPHGGARGEIQHHWNALSERSLWRVDPLFADNQMRRASPEFKTGPIAALARDEKPLQIKWSTRA
jgi:hypothetical protein